MTKFSQYLGGATAAMLSLAAVTSVKAEEAVSMRKIVNNIKDGVNFGAEALLESQHDAADAEFLKAAKNLRLFQNISKELIAYALVDTRGDPVRAAAFRIAAQRVSQHSKHTMACRLEVLLPTNTGFDSGILAKPKRKGAVRMHLVSEAPFTPLPPLQLPMQIIPDRYTPHYWYCTWGRLTKT